MGTLTFGRNKITRQIRDLTRRGRILNFPSYLFYAGMLENLTSCTQVRCPTSQHVWKDRFASLANPRAKNSLRILGDSCQTTCSDTSNPTKSRNCCRPKVIERFGLATRKLDWRC